MAPYAAFLVDFERRHADHVHRNDPRNTLAAVIVESRPDYFLPKVIRNVMYFLGPAWNLYVFTAPATAGYLHRSLPSWDLAIMPLPEQLLFPQEWQLLHHQELAEGSVSYQMPRPAYNHLLTQPGFWRSVTEEKVLTFQADALLTGRNIADYLRWDYVGAPCTTFDENCLANGGLALRSRQMMLDCLEIARPVRNEPEDTFYTSRVRQLGGAMPDVETAARFAVQTAYVRHPVGVHGTDKYSRPASDAPRE